MGHAKFMGVDFDLFLPRHKGRGELKSRRAGVSEVYKESIRIVMNIYVGNIPYSTSEDDLRSTFSEYGEVSSAKVIMDRDSGRSKGFGFVEMDSNDAGAQAIKALDGTEMEGRNIKVNEARPREDRARA